MHASRKSLNITIYYSRKALALLKPLYLAGVVAHYHLSINQQGKKRLTMAPTYYKRTPLTKHITLLSTPSHSLFISYKALVLLKKRLGVASYLISTSHGIITHQEAVRKKLGGILLALLFI